MSYTYRSSDLNFRTDNGDGSNALDVDDVAALQTHTAALEVIRYMLPSRAAITPYGSLGVHGTWWVLDEKTPLVTSSGASTRFTVSPLFSFGLQFTASDKWSGRLEATMSGGHNPFAGNKSFRAQGGPAIDEPTGVNRTDFRLAGVYYFSRLEIPKITAPMADK
jgi:hypothetical protein